MEPLMALVGLLTIAVSAGVAYGVLKVNGLVAKDRLDALEREAIDMDSAMRSRVDQLTAEVQRHKQDTTDRLARIETKLDILLQTKFQQGG